MTPAAFLSALRPNNHLLVTIDPRSRRVGSRHFARATDPELLDLLTYAQQQKLNVYYALNPPSSDKDKKPGKKELAKVEWLHTDLDPNPALPPEEARQKIREMLSSLPEEVKPTFVVDSGNGYQAAWRLDLALPPSSFDAADALNKGIEYRLGADVGTYNIDRILRLPGTTNWPDAKKEAKGRKPAPAVLVSFEPRTFTPDEIGGVFPPIQPPPDKEESKASIDFREVYACHDYADLPQDLRARFESVCVKNEKIAALWGGNAEGLNDPSGSGVAFALAHHLLHTDLFSDTEVAHLIYVCEHTSDFEKMDERYLSRAVSRNAPARPAKAEDEFEAAEENPAVTAEQDPESASRAKKGTLFKPYTRRAFLPPRKWLYGHEYIKQFTTVTVAPGGVGKTALGLVEACAMVSNRPLLGVTPVHKLRVAYWNGEDPLEEIERRLWAIQKWYDIKDSELDGLFIQSGRDQPMILARMHERSPMLVKDTSSRIVDFVKSERVDVCVVDPFVSTHETSENDNNAIDMVVKAWNRIADQGGVAAHIVHHSRKTNGREVEVEDGRGAVALLAGARSARVLNVMSEEESEKCGILNRRSYFKVENGKSNLAPPSERASWFRHVSVDLENAEPPYPSDNVGVVESWAWIERSLDLDEESTAAILSRLGAGEYAASPKSKEWAGYEVAIALGLDVDQKSERKLAAEAIERLVTDGKLLRVQGKDRNRNTRECIRVA